MEDKQHKDHKCTLDKYWSKAEHYICSCLNKNNGTNNNNMQYVSSATFLLTEYLDFLKARTKRSTTTEEWLAQKSSSTQSSTTELDMVLNTLQGRTTGVHRLCPIKRTKGSWGAQGYDTWYIGGPDCPDNFSDQRGNYMQTEACTYNTTPLVGVFAKLNHLGDKQEIPNRNLIAYF
ncbi:hypothetical protein CsSME_00046192 [Camellia sinensis var. sinensis]